MNLSGKRVLVTGGAGFIGTALAQRLASDCARWVAYDNLLPQVHGPSPTIDLGPAVELVEGDVRDAATLRSAVSRCRPDVVIHLAAETGTGQSLSEPSRHTDVNVTGTAVLFEALEDHLPQKIVLTSSRAVYGEGTWRDAGGVSVRPGPRPAHMLARGDWDFPGLTPVASAAASSVPDPSNIYGATKLAQEHLVRAWASSRSVGAGILRLQNVYGPGQSPINPYTGITTLFVNLAKRGQTIPVYEDGNITRDFVFIDDVVQAIVSVAGSQRDCLVDVGSGAAASIFEMAQIIADIREAPRPDITGQYRLGDVRHAWCDMTDSEWVRDSRPPVSLEHGLRRLSDWIAGMDVAVVEAERRSSPTPSSAALIKV